MSVKVRNKAIKNNQLKNVLELRKTYSVHEIAAMYNTSLIAVQGAIYRGLIRHNTFGQDHQDEKLIATKEFISRFTFTQDDTIIDAFAGLNKVYNSFNLKANYITNDKYNDLCDYKLDAGQFLKLMAALNIKSKLVDIDPCGSAGHYIDDALKLVQPGGGLIITDGFVPSRFCTDETIALNYSNTNKLYGLQTKHKDHNINMDIMAQGIIKRAKLHSVTLRLYKSYKLGNVYRFYFDVIA